MSKFRRMVGFSQDGGWPYGADGALVYTGGAWTLNGVPVGVGSTYTLTNGQNKDFSSVSIDAGGTLEFLQWSNWPMMGCKGNFTNNGTIKCVDFNNGSFSATAPDFVALSHTIQGGNGGNGGTSGNNGIYAGAGAAGGSASDGNGGGGGSGGFASQNWSIYISGNVGTSAVFGNAGQGANKKYVSGLDATWNSNNGSNTGGGSGPVIYGGNGGNGANALGPGSNEYGGGAGGGGGSRGHNGGCLYFRIKGNIAGNGSFLLGGTNGGNGGAGGSGYSADNGDSFGPLYYGAPPGGGGGAGGGGSGGKLVIKYSGSNTQTWSHTYAAGSAGTVGAAGTRTIYAGSAAGLASAGGTGTGGQAGVAPSITVF